MGSKDLGNKQIDRVQPELNLFWLYIFFY
jgi:hypothetical protein